MTIRDIGIFCTRLLPFSRTLARGIYRRLPQRLHDTPTSFIERLLGEAIGVTFLQVGAFDGIAGDPLRPLILAHPSWQGALVEPMPTAFNQLVANYAATPAMKLQFLNCAVSDTCGSLEMYEIEESEIKKLELPPWSREVASVSEGHLKKHFPFAQMRRRTVIAETVERIAEICGYRTIDLLVIDAEGHEGPIINSLNFDALGIRVLLFEHIHFTPNQFSQLQTFLYINSFKLKQYGRDTIAYR